MTGLVLNSPFFRRLFIPYLALICLAVGAVGVFAVNRLKATYLERTEQAMRDQSQLVAELVEQELSAGRGRQLQAEVQRLGRALSCRITVVQADGTVLADSEADPARMESHRLRPELLAAAAEGQAHSQRYSDTLDQSMFYFARRVTTTPSAEQRSAGQEAGSAYHLIRLAVPLRSLTPHLQALTSQLILIALLAIGVAAAICYYFARRHAMPVVELTDFAEALSKGRMDRRLLRPGTGETGTLTRSLNAMADSLSQLVGRAEEDKAQLLAVLSSMSEGVIATDTHQRIVLCNQAAGKLLGFAPVGAQGKLLCELVRSQPVLGSAGTVLAEKTPQRFQVTPSAGRYLEVAVRTFPAHGDPKGLVIVVHDATQTVRYQELRKEFVANVSHELRTPLALIKGFAETLRDGAVHDPVKGPQYLATIEKHVDQLTNLVGDLLELSRLESYGDLPRTMPLDVGPLARRAVDLLSPAARKKGHSLVVDVAAHLPQVLGNSDYLERAVVNLVDNAIKYTPERGRITVSVHAEGQTVVVEVSDTGLGIPQEDLPRIFERFYRVDRSRSREMGGTGLGLSIVKHVAQSHGGHVDVTSTVGQGSCFRLILPVTAVSA